MQILIYLCKGSRSSDLHDYDMDLACATLSFAHNYRSEDGGGGIKMVKFGKVLRFNRESYRHTSEMNSQTRTAGIWLNDR